MDFSLSDEQQLLKDSIDRFCSDQSDGADAQQQWQAMAELGWLAMPFVEELGGFGGSVVESCLVMEGLGRSASVSPFWSSVLLAGGLLAAAPVSPRRDELLNALMSGEIRVTPALFEGHYADTLEAWQCRAQAHGDQWSLNGRKVLVPSADFDVAVVVARSDAGSLNAFLIPADSAGLSVQPVSMMDGSEGCSLLLDEVLVDASARLFADGGFESALQKVLLESTVALAAEAQGAMDALLRDTVEYTKGRKQFGVAIGSFQALQHRMVDMYADAELCRAMLLRAQCAVLDNSPDQSEIVAALKCMIGRKGRKIAEEAVQLHGGMGVSQELPIGRYLKRLMMIDVCLGSADIQRERFYQQRYAELA